MNAPVTTVDKHSGPVRFHRLSDEYGAFTNFSRHPVVIAATEWPTCEHFFQAAKFTDADHVLQIRQAPSPRRAAALGRSRYVPVRPDWDTVRVDVMRTGVRAKFVQHPHLADLLMSTGDRSLIESTPRDPFWGAGPDGTGRNTNGQILTEIRSELGTSSPAWDPPDVTSRRWVAFGETTIVLPWQQRSRTGLVARALAVLRHLSAGGEWRYGQRDDPQAHVLVEVAGEGGVLLRSPGLHSGTDVAAALTRSATEAITWVNDPALNRARP